MGFSVNRRNSLRSPACAGKSERQAYSPAIRQDHPRVCGEKFTVIVAASVDLGSPPRVRGKVCARSRWTSAKRITPACAGKRLTGAPTFPPQQDHPRVCGEKLFSSPMMASSLGSPPRVRGKATSTNPVQNKVRITPACAGKSPLVRAVDCCYEDHPRVCGEKASPPAVLVGIVGSPPRVRGKGPAGHDADGGSGITPACAGKRIFCQSPPRF